MRNLSYPPLSQRGLMAETVQNLIVAFLIAAIFCGMFVYQNHRNDQKVATEVTNKVQVERLEDVIRQQELGAEIEKTGRDIETTTTQSMTKQETATVKKAESIKQTAAKKTQETVKNPPIEREPGEKQHILSVVVYEQLTDAYCLADPGACTKL